MNCLGPKRGSNEYDTVEPSAPPYYPPQLPYNPHFMDPHVISVSDNLGFIYPWGAHDNNSDIEHPVKNEGFERAWRRERSLYEGVNYVPVSVLQFPVLLFVYLASHILLCFYDERVPVLMLKTLNVYNVINIEHITKNGCLLISFLKPRFT